MSAITTKPGDDPLNWLWESAQAALWFNDATPEEQMLGALVLTVVAYVSTALSLGATAIAIVITTGLFFVGLARFIWQLTMG